MPDHLDAQALSAELRKQAATLGLTIGGTGPLDVRGEAEYIRAKWWLGGRKLTYRMGCRIAEAERTVHFREAEIERSWGIPPPTLTVEVTTTSGWKRSGTRTDKPLGGGGGTLDYARVRETIERIAADAGWKFHFEGGRMP